jgi:hypothetical protein
MIGVTMRSWVAAVLCTERAVGGGLLSWPVHGIAGSQSPHVWRQVLPAPYTVGFVPDEGVPGLVVPSVFYRIGRGCK